MQRPQMQRLQTQPPLHMPPQSLSQFPFQQNFTAPPLLPPLPHYQQQHQQQFAPDFLPQVFPSPQYSRSPISTNQAARHLNSLSSQLLGQISQEPKKQKQSRQMGSRRDFSQPPILPALIPKRKQ